ncbi:hypothetical protein QYF50_07280 [Paenibacillus vini]|uniref:hypothetical protein n=1 Tax=Paenibacillus vini TaxID=1476024 RepID=UPI0025B6ACAB|nr:hypothetical protein [Paenibacillus vini]MDN4067694.1 hypothetical protein [Paenibacillus vini]
MKSQTRVEELLDFLKNNDFTPEQILIILVSICAEIYGSNAEDLLIKMRDEIKGVNN